MPLVYEQALLYELVLTNYGVRWWEAFHCRKIRFESCKTAKL